MDNPSFSYIPSLPPQVLNMIETQGDGRASVILMMTDGVLQDSPTFLRTEPDIARRDLGVRVFAVGVGNDVSEMQVYNHKM